MSFAALAEGERGVFPKPEAGSFVCVGISPAGGDLKTVLCAEREYFPKQSKTEKF